jgi:hypothetical protein
MTLIVLNEISNYWDKTKITPIHEVTKWISRDRFQELHMRVQLAGMATKGAYVKVSKAPLYFVLIFSLNSNEILSAKSSLYPRTSKTLI